MFCAVPLAGVSERPVTSTLKERREVAGGGASGFATSVTLRVALPPPPPPEDLGMPLQAIKERVDTRKARRNGWLRFIGAPKARLRGVCQASPGQLFKTRTIYDSNAGSSA